MGGIEGEMFGECEYWFFVHDGSEARIYSVLQSTCASETIPQYCGRPRLMTDILELDKY